MMVGLSETKLNRTITILSVLSFAGVITAYQSATLASGVIGAVLVSLVFVLYGFKLFVGRASIAVNDVFREMMTPYFITCFLVMCGEVVNTVFIAKDASVLTVTKIIGANFKSAFWASGLTTEGLGTVIPKSVGILFLLPALCLATIGVYCIITYIKNPIFRYATASASLLVAFLSAQYFWLPFSLQSALFGVPFLLFGFELAGKFESNKFSNIKTVIGAIVLLPASVFILYVRQTTFLFETAQSSDILFSVIGIATACFAITIIANALPYNKVLRFMEKYAVMLLCVFSFNTQVLAPYKDRLAAVLPLGNYRITRVLENWLWIAFVFGIALLFRRLSEMYKKKRPSLNNILNKKNAPKRDMSIDVAKGLLIILMIVGHGRNDAIVTRLIYSFHMPAFIIFSGFFFKSTACENPILYIKRSITSLLVPYFIWTLISIPVMGYPWLPTLRDALFGVSFTRKVFTSFGSVGPIYFVFLLFWVRIFYMLIRKYINREWLVNAVVLALSFAGVVLGKLEIWLPWSLDCALYSLIFYHIGHYLKRYHILAYISTRYVFYFALSLLWAYMMQKEWLELALRHYGNYIVCVLGAVSASILLYMLCQYIGKHLPSFITSIFAWFGKQSIYILIVHTMFASKLTQLIALRFTAGYLPYLVTAIVLQTVCGSVLGETVSFIKRLPSKIKRKSI